MTTIYTGRQPVLFRFFSRMGAQMVLKVLTYSVVVA